MIRPRLIKHLIFHRIGLSFLATVLYSTFLITVYFYFVNLELREIQKIQKILKIQLSTEKYMIKHNYVHHSNYTDVLSQNPFQKRFQNSSDEIQKLNSEQKIYNLDTFGPVTNSTFVIVIQVHDRLRYLNVLLDCLSRVRQIEQALLIFSHDVFIPSLNQDIRNVNFTKVMQIFFPYSSQNETNMITKPADNYSTTTKSNSSKLRKKGSRGAQIKHHWWWKANFVFHQIEVLKNFNGYISFTEEDTYFTADALLMFNLMAKMMGNGKVCNECQVITMAEGPPVLFSSISSINDIEIASVFKRNVVSVHFAFNRTIWMKIKACDSTFCEYEDYNWDWSLYHLFESPKCMFGSVKQLIMKKPRVYHTGNCGYHHYGKRCDPDVYASKAKMLSRMYSQVYPKTVNFTKPRVHKWLKKWSPKPWGSWNKNDGILCMNVSRNFGGDDSQSNQKDNDKVRV